MTSVTKPQKELLKSLIQRGGKASPFALGYPRTPMLRRMHKAGLIERGNAPIYDEWNCDLSITQKGRDAANGEITAENPK